MKRLLLALALLTAIPALSQPDPNSLVGRGGWVSGYYPAWAWYNGTPAGTNLVNMGCFTHILFASGSPNGNGTFTWYTNGQNMLLNMQPIMQDAGIKGIFQICCAGWDWETSARAENLGGFRKTFITNLLNVLSTYDMDGIDLDWEPIQSTHYNTFRGFVKDLRDSMTARWGNDAGRKLIVCYSNPDAEPAFTVDNTYQYIDQINVQGYDLVSPSWSVCSGNGNDYHVSWHQGPLFHGGHNCPATGHMPNLYDILMDFVDAGVPKAKLGMSTRWNASIWKGGTGTSTGGVSRPLQTWTSAPAMWNDQPAYYWWAITGLTQAQIDAAPRTFDAATGATYVGYDVSGSANDFFLSYDDSIACAAKVKAVTDSGFGGVYVWTTEGRENVKQSNSLTWWSRSYAPGGGPIAGPPIMSTNSASQVTQTTATLNGSANANLASTTVTFEYGPTTSYGSTVTADQSPVTGGATVGVSKGITGLTAGTLSHYRVKGVNSEGTTNGNDVTFTTVAPPAAPTALTGAATSVSTTSATVNGTCSANGVSTTVKFFWRAAASATWDSAAATQSPMSGQSVAVSKGLSGLATGTQYFFYVKAVSTSGVAIGNQLTFTTTAITPTQIKVLLVK